MMIFICGIFKQILTTFANFYLQMGNRVVYISYNRVLLSYSRGRRRARASRREFFPCSFKREATGAELTFRHSIIGNFMFNKI